MGERRGTKALEAWCKRATQGYPGVKVENMTTSWRDGLAVCALIHHFRPDLIDFDSLDKSNVIGNNELAFRVAERHLGIPALLDAEDMAEYAVPDRLSILTYLSQFYQVFYTHPSSPGKKPTDSDSSIASLADVPSSPNMEGASPWRELCVVCNDPVYLAQRLRVQGSLYHRTCFRCARCSAQLSLVDYYETHDGKFCCETCPDEVAVDGVSSELDEGLWPAPELSPGTRQSIVAMRRMFFDTDDAKLNRSESLQIDLPPADIPTTPTDKVKLHNVNSLVADKLSEIPKQNSVANTGADVEYQSDNISLTPTKRSLDKSNDSSLKLDDLDDKSNTVDSNGQINNSNDSQLVASEPEAPHSPINKLADQVKQTKLIEEKPTLEVLKIVETCELRQGEADTRAEADQLGESKNVDGTEELVVTDESHDERELSGAFENEDKLNFGVSDGENAEVVEAVNENLAPPPHRPKRRQKSPKAPHKAITQKPPPDEYPEELNPFNESETEPKVGTNPFGSDSEEEESAPAVTSTPLTSPRKGGGDLQLSPVRRAASLNPFGDSDEEEEGDLSKANLPVPLPRRSAASPDPMPFPRSALRSSLRSIASTSSRKKRPAPPPPPTPPSPSATIRSTRSRKTRRAPLPPGICSSRLSLASDNVSLGGYSLASDFPLQVSAVADRISEWVETSQIETDLDVTKTTSDETSELMLTCSTPSKLECSPKPTNPPLPAISVTEESSLDLSTAIDPPTPAIKHYEPTNDVIRYNSIDDLKKDLSPDNSLRHIIEEDTSSNIPPKQFEKPSPKRAPAAPLEPKISIVSVDDRLSIDKKNKNDANMIRKISGGSTGSSSGGYSLHKSAHGQWRRKKAPAPPLPLNPDQRTVTKEIPLLRIKQELNDIEIKQQGLERQGVALEARIRDKFDSGASITPYVEELVLQLFELVNEKNELFRKQAELMYLRRQQHLEEEQSDLEKEIRVLMGQPEANRTDTDKELEEQLIQRLVEVVERRDAIIQCLEMDRIREAEEDRSISAQLNVFTKALSPNDRTIPTLKKQKKGSESSKKKWYTLSRSPKKAHSSGKS